MKIYVNVNAGHDGNGTEQMPFRHINDAAKIAQPGDEVWVAPGVYREYVDPVHAGREDARITYRSVEPLGAVIKKTKRILNNPLKGVDRYVQQSFDHQLPESCQGALRASHPHPPRLQRCVGV